MSCPNCPGPTVPHRCKKGLGSLAYQLRALQKTVGRRGRPDPRLMRHVVGGAEPKLQSSKQPHTIDPGVTAAPPMGKDVIGELRGESPVRQAGCSAEAGPSPALQEKASQPLEGAVAEPPGFVASDNFAGPKPGYYFSRGEKGLGYYRDWHGTEASRLQEGAVAEPLGFVASDHWAGHRAGYYFSCGVQGLGYYRDHGAVRELWGESLGASGPSPRPAGTEAKAKARAVVSKTLVHPAEQSTTTQVVGKLDSAKMASPLALADVNVTPRSMASTESTATTAAQSKSLASVETRGLTCPVSVAAEVSFTGSGPIPEPAAEEEPVKQTPQDRPAAAKRLFKCVAGVLNGAFGVEQVSEYIDDISAWLDEDTLDEQDAVLDGALRGISAGRSVCVSFALACDALAAAVEAGAVPPPGIKVLVDLFDRLENCGITGNARLPLALKPHLCPRCYKRPPASPQCDQCHGSGNTRCKKCGGSGQFTVECRMCSGSGRDRRRNSSCAGCLGTGCRINGECFQCHGKKGASCDACDLQPEIGRPRPLCTQCLTAQRTNARAQVAPARARPREPEGPPPEGVSVDLCSAGDLALLSKLWQERKGHGQVEQAWKVDNPLLAWNCQLRKKDLEQELGRLPDTLDGFHGTHPDNILSICRCGFDRSKRGSAVGQVYGAGEYFAKCPNVSVNYCRGGEYMLVCRLYLGWQSSSEANLDGDHIWVPQCGYYVISSPWQVLPLYILKFRAGGRGHGMYSMSPQNDELQRVLRSKHWTTKTATAIKPVPPNRPCLMSRPSATVLWIGFLHAHLSDESLDWDVRAFLGRHAPGHVAGLKVQIVKGTFKKAHAVLSVPMERELVHRLNKLPFVEDGQERTICVEDSHGSPEQKCPKFIAGYCRGHNLRFTHPCWCWHEKRKTERARFRLVEVELDSAKGNEIASKFMASAPFHDGKPHVVAIKAINNQVLERCHEEYRRYLKTKHGEEPTVRELYHGTNNKILDVLYTHGLQPPSDTEASDACPVSGGKGLSTTLCNNDCPYCTKKHQWNRCHMYGLGIYLGDLAQKSHRYASQPELNNGRRRYRMILCSVLGKAFKLEGHLRRDRAMHDVANHRAVQEDELEEMVEPCCMQGGSDPMDVCEKSDLLYVQGLGAHCRPGFSVFNSEYIAFHPHQCLPKYEIIYDM